MDETARATLKATLKDIFAETKPVELSVAAHVWVTTFRQWHEQDIPLKKVLFGKSTDYIVPFSTYILLLILNLGSGLKYHWERDSSPQAQEYLRQFEEASKLPSDGSYPLYAVMNFLVSVYPDTNKWGTGVRQAVVEYCKERKYF